jgi:hypothetical protein
MSSAETELFSFSDRMLACHLEMAEALSSVAFVEAKRMILPESDVQWTKVAGTYLIYAGPSSPLTQTFGLGLFDSIANTDMDFIEEFFRERGAAVFHEISPLTDAALLNLLVDRGYSPIEFTNVMYRQIHANSYPIVWRNPRIRVREIQNGEAVIWSETAAKGWSESGDFAELMKDVGRVSAHGSGAHLFLAEMDGEPIAAGSLSVTDRVALFAGASTVPDRRRLGGQLALLEARLDHGGKLGCELAMICVPPGSSSQRNAEKYGFRIAYTRLRWQLGRGHCCASQVSASTDRAADPQ